MSSTATMNVTNNSPDPIDINSITINPAANHDFIGTDIPGVCTDIIFRILFVQNLLRVTLNGMLLSADSLSSNTLIQDLASGNISL